MPASRFSVEIELFSCCLVEVWMEIFRKTRSMHMFLHFKQCLTMTTLSLNLQTCSWCAKWLVNGRLLQFYSFSDDIFPVPFSSYMTVLHIQCFFSPYCDRCTESAVIDLKTFCSRLAVNIGRGYTVKKWKLLNYHICNWKNILLDIFIKVCLMVLCIIWGICCGRKV